MRRRTALRSVWLFSALMMGSVWFMGPAHAQRPDNIQFEIPAQPLANALIEFGDQSGRSILASPELTSGINSTGVSAESDSATALQKMLEGTGLTFRNDGEVYVIVREGAAIAPGDEAPGVEPAAGIEPDIAEGPTTASVETTRRGGIEEIIVTGQKRAERIQDVPIAISAFSMKDLDDQKIEGGFDLLKGVPNVTFSKTNFSGYNFQIRGIGTQAVSATTDPGVAVSFNNTTLIVNRLFEQEYLDIERVEVLRGPQGTLYGRNATAGVINVISAKPELGVYEGELKLETGNYGAKRLRGYYNLPIGENFALRAAYGSTVRDGYGYNQYDGSDIDDRDLWTGRLTLGWEPNERTRVNLLYERFEEDDGRVRSVKQLCHRDEGLTHLGSVDLSTFTGDATGTGEAPGDILQDTLSQGCLPGSLFDDAAFGTPNGYAIPFLAAPRIPVTAGALGDNPYFGSVSFQAPCDIYETARYLTVINSCVGDPFENSSQSREMRTIFSVIDPSYQADSDIFELAVDFDITSELVLSSQTVYVKDSVLSTQDFNRFETSKGFFSDSTNACPFSFSGSNSFFGCVQSPALLGASAFADLMPNGIFCDPQLGCSDRFLFMDMSRASSRQFNQEVRLVSSFKGDFNFSIGANYTKFETTNDYFVMSNGLTMLAMTAPFRGAPGSFPSPLCYPDDMSVDFINCVYVDPQSLDELANDDSPEGHNYFLSRNPYELSSAAVFGEAYLRVTDTLKLTGGLRVTWDRKSFTPVPSQTLLMGYKQTNLSYEVEDPSQCTSITIAAFCSIMGNTADGRGYTRDPEIVQSWMEPTGRLGFDWKLDTGFTDETMVYGFLTRGYKAGGANPPGISKPSGGFTEAAQGAASPKIFKAEYVNALELGAKNKLFGGAMTLNVSGFYYDYKDYQVSKIVDRSAANENFDATVWGLELEAVVAATADTLFNVAVGYLRTRIEDGEESLDLMDRTQGGGGFFVTTIENPNYNGTLMPRSVDSYIVGLDAPADQQYLAFDEWIVIKPSITQSSNCIAPLDLLEVAATSVNGSAALIPSAVVSAFCPAGNFIGQSYASSVIPGTASLFPSVGGLLYDARVDAPNGSAGFLADVGGNELPNAPRFTVSLGAQHTLYLPGGWDLTGRADWYWQDKSFHRVYNTEYDRLKAWTNTNLSIWASKKEWDLKIEAYVKNIFDDTPITGAFLNSDDTALTTNVFTLDPRLIGVSITKRF
jgi:iron complex outermembrane receptor protein